MADLEIAVKELASALWSVPGVTNVTVDHNTQPYLVRIVVDGRDISDADRRRMLDDATDLHARIARWASVDVEINDAADLVAL